MNRLTGVRLEDARFLTSANAPAGFPPADSREVAFIGRSNAGKSSALNALTGRRRLAFVSKTPGRTQLVNFFAVGDGARLVDLPGYGYAGVPLEVRRHWDGLVGGYLLLRGTLAGVVVVMDCRHPLAPADRRFLEWLRPARRPVHVLLSKADKLSGQAARLALAEAHKQLESSYPGAGVQLFSSLTRAGVSEARARIAELLEGPKQNAPAKGE